MVNLDVDDTELHDFANSYPMIMFKKGANLIRPGYAPADLLFIKSGRVHQLDITPSGNEVIVNIFAEPAFLSFFWLFEVTENRFTYRAVTDVAVHKVPREDLQQFLLQHPRVMYNTLKRVVNGLDGFITRMTYQMFGSAEKKIAVELLLEAKRFHKQKQLGIIIDSNINDLTARTGLARETVSRQISSLLQKGLIEKQKNKISIVNVSLLEDFVAVQ